MPWLHIQRPVAICRHIFSFFIISIHPVFMFKNNSCTCNYNLDGRVDDNSMSYVVVVGAF